MRCVYSHVLVRNVYHVGFSYVQKSVVGNHLNVQRMSGHIFQFNNTSSTQLRRFHSNKSMSRLLMPWLLASLVISKCGINWVRQGCSCYIKDEFLLTVCNQMS